MYGAAALMLAVSASSCRLSDPEGIENPDAESTRLTSISLYSMKLVNYSYDDQGRLSQISDRINGTEIDFGYNPSIITITEREGGDDDYSYRDIWSDITFNPDGSIAQWKENEYRYDIQLNEWIFDGGPYFHSCTYDNDGHLVRLDNDDESTLITWEAGDMKKIISDDVNLTVLSTNLENKTGQWSAFWMPMLVYGTTGLFGKAPEHLPARFSGTMDDGEYDVEFAYQLNNFGMIALEKMLIEGETEIYQYNYAR